MAPMDTEPHASTFIIRLFHDESGGVSGVVERVRTGIKERFDGCDGLCRLITWMVETDKGLSDAPR